MACFFLGEGLVHTSWLLLILTRAMEHESKLIQTWAINYTLCLDMKKISLPSQHGQHFIFDTLFESLKNNFLYTNAEHDCTGDPPKVFPLLKQFFTSCFSSLSEKQLSEFLTKVINFLKAIVYSCFYVFHINCSKSPLKN